MRKHKYSFYVTGQIKSCLTSLLCLVSVPPQSGHPASALYNLGEKSLLRILWRMPSSSTELLPQGEHEVILNMNDTSNVFKDTYVVHTSTY